MQDIMEATQMEKGGIYRHFASKEALATACFQFSLKQAMNARSGDVDHISNAPDQLRYLVRRFVSASSTIPGGCPLMNTAIEADDGNPQLRQLAREGLRDWKKKLTKIVSIGKKQGNIREDIAGEDVANSLIALLEGALMISRLEADSRALRAVPATFETLLREIIVP